MAKSAKPNPFAKKSASTAKKPVTAAQAGRKGGRKSPGQGKKSK